jgi:cytochrome c-type biogenesis protein CcmH
VRRAALAFAVALFAAPVMAEPAPAPDQPLASPAQEARAQALFQDIRCVVCQHESIADSPAGIAADMRRLVREEIAPGPPTKPSAKIWSAAGATTYCSSRR